MKEAPRRIYRDLVGAPGYSPAPERRVVSLRHHPRPDELPAGRRVVQPTKNLGAATKLQTRSRNGALQRKLSPSQPIDAKPLDTTDGWPRQRGVCRSASGFYQRNNNSRTRPRG